MDKYTLRYGLDPEKPYRVSFITGNQLAIAEEAKEPAEIQTARESARTDEEWQWLSYDTAMAAGIFAACVGQTLGNGCTTYDVKVERSINLAGQDITWAPLATYGYAYGPFTAADVYTLIPNSVVGCQGYTGVRGAVRSYKWGLFNNQVAGAVPNRTTVTTAIWTTSSAVGPISLYDFIHFIGDGDMKAVSSADTTDTEPVSVNVVRQVRYGTRRS